MVKLILISLATFALIFGLANAAFANTPGKTPPVTLTWTDPCTACTFNMYRGSATGVCTGTPTPLVTGISGLTYVDASVTAGTTYVYAVSAVDSAGHESACSNEAQAVPSLPPTPGSLQAK